MNSSEANMLTFGPVPSRRLGRSLGINNIPPKFCSYSCIYCQVGPTHVREIAQRGFYPPAEIAESVQRRVVAAREAGERIDYLTFVPDGEPTLDEGLGEAIERLRPLGIPIAVISNASLLWQEAVRTQLREADWVSVKIDTVDEALWQALNRPHPELSLQTLLEGIETFAGEYRGTLATETMLVQGVNDQPDAVTRAADFIARLAADTAYISIPTRPPTVADVRAPEEATINRVFQIFNARLEKVELLIGYEGDAFSHTGDAVQDLLSILSVHPMREEAVLAFLQRAGETPHLLQTLLLEGRIKQVEFANKKFYIRRLPGRG